MNNMPRKLREELSNDEYYSMIQETSKQAYYNLPMMDLQDKVLKVLKTCPNMTNQEIAKAIGKDASTVSGVNVPMRRLGKIEEAGKRICQVTGRRVIAWKVKSSFPAAFAPKKETNNTLF
jgi:hypothetical protein